MKIATYKVEPLRGDTFSLSTELTGTFARFGDEVICSVADREWPLLAESAETAEVKLTKLHEASDKDRLYSVVQVGNSFCRKQPDVPVVLDRGRHLAVILELERAIRLLTLQLNTALLVMNWAISPHENSVRAETNKTAS